MNDVAISVSKNRYRALDSLRGIAACTVALGHFCNLAPLIFLRHTPMRFLLGGHEAVLLFFVLSGFVLTIQISSRPLNYAAYAVQRITRIYLPYIVACLLALVCYLIFHAQQVPWAGSWFGSTWQASLPNDVISGHLILLLPYRTDSLLPILWTLVYEMRISLILPLIVRMIKKTHITLTIVIALFLSGLGCVLISISEPQLIFSSLKADWLPTLHYSAIFMIGVTLALKRESIVNFVCSRRLALRVLLVGIGFYFLGSPIGFKMHSVFGDFIYDWCVAMGAGLIIVSAIAGKKISQALNHSFLIFFGEISYSLYLLHTLTMMVVLRLVGEALPHVVTILLAILLTVPIAYASYRWVEVPSIAFGRLLSRKIRSSGDNVVSSIS